MIRSVLLCAILLVAVRASAEEIHKCVSENGTSYQGLPCEARDQSASFTSPDATPPTRSSNKGDTPECSARPRSPMQLPWRQATICIGMTDDEVLNLPGWGRPGKIVRTREPHRWHEDWTYDAGSAGQRLLHFVNGKLAGLETEAAAGQEDPPARVVAN